MQIDLKELKELMKTLKQFDLAEIELEKRGERIKIRRMESPVMAAPSAVVSVSQPSVLPQTTAASEAATAAKSREGLVAITSPFVGTFYRSSSPDAGSFVEVGASIKKGKVLCIVEAMKLMNEIESDISGVIEEILAENGKPVEYGAELFLVRKT